jgi:hypothetical protein
VRDLGYRGGQAKEGGAEEEEEECEKMHCNCDARQSMMERR